MQVVCFGVKIKSNCGSVCNGLEEATPKLSVNINYIKKIANYLILIVLPDDVDALMQGYNDYDTHIKFIVDTENDRSFHF